MKRRRHSWIVAAALAAACLPAGAPEEAGTDEDEQPIDEIVVVVNKRGDRVDVDALYLEQLRDRIVRDYEFAQAEQEEEIWRQSLPTSVSEPDSRISWGYDARSEAAMRRTSMINDLPMDRVKPATVISVSF